jgi:single-stranded-DNA-specific exonuclease
MIALDGREGTGSGRSIPAFDLLGGLDACAEHLLRHGGHRAAAGCTVARDAVEPLRAAFAAHAAAVLAPEDLVPVERVDAVVAGDELGLALAEELEQLAPFGTANPEVSLLVPAARLADPRAMGEGRHLRCTVESGGARARAVALRRLPAPRRPRGPARCRLRAGAQRVGRRGRAAAPPAPRRPAAARPGRGPRRARRTAGYVAAVLAALDDTAPLGPPRRDASPAGLAATAHAGASPGGLAAAARADASPARDARAASCAIAAAAASPARSPRAVASGEPVLVACADAPRRRGHLDGRLGGFALASWETLEREPALAAPFRHVVALDPPAHLPPARLAGALPGRAYLSWPGGPRRRPSPWPPRSATSTCARRWRRSTARCATGADPDDGRGPGLEAVLRGPGPGSRPPFAAARLLRVLLELGLAELDPEAPAVRLLPATRRDLGDSAAFRAAAERLALARRLLAPDPAAVAA